VRPVAGPEGPVEQQCSDRMTGSNSYWPVHPAGATGALTSTGSDPRLESNRLPRCSVFKDRVPRGHLFRVVCSDPTGSRSRRSDHPTPWRGWTIPRGGGESVVDAASDSKAARYDTTLWSQCQRPALLSWLTLARGPQGRRRSIPAQDRVSTWFSTSFVRAGNGAAVSLHSPRPASLRADRLACAAVRAWTGFRPPRIVSSRAQSARLGPAPAAAGRHEQGATWIWLASACS
jgi:hypothetical protein